PVLRTQHRYLSQPGLSGSAWPWLALEQETLVHVNGGNAELQKTRHTYLNAPSDKLLHGRKSQTAVTLNGKTTTTDYAYLKATGQYVAQPVLRTMETLKTNFDAVSKVIILEHSLFNGRALLERDDNDVEIAYAYDALGRVIEEKVAPGSNVEARRQYQYLLVNQVTGQPTQTTIDVKGVLTRSLLDGLQRVVSELRQDVDGNPVSKPLRETYSASYDAFGQLSESTEFDWLGAETVALTSRYTYDDWSEQDSVTGPDGIIAHNRYDPITMTRHTWQQGTDGKRGNLDRVTYNLFEKPLKSEVLDSDDKVVSTAEQRYDGLGHCRQEISVLGKSTFYRYDPWDRVSLTVLPDETQIVRAYAGHSSAELAVSLDVTPGSGNRATLRLGEQQFDGLERLTHLDVGPRSQQYRYQGGRLQPDERITAGGQSIRYEYTPNLTRLPVGLIAPDEQASYTYDRSNAQLTVTENNQGRREFAYDSASYLSHERWIVDGTTWEALSTYSLAGRLIRHTDVNGLETAYEYDVHGRVESVTQGRLQASFAYDSLGRAWRTTTRDLDTGTELVTSLAFDDHGREIERVLALSGQPPQTLTQAWRLDNRLQSRHQQSAGTSLKEVFDYDVRGRLIRHDCSGQTLPTDRYGNAIASQTFDYDGLDNLLHVSTRFADGSSDESARSFADDDPCQLVRISHTHADYPDSQDLSYDADGHLLADENGNGLHYDSQGRLLRVTSETGQNLSQYRYDGHNQLTGVAHGEEAQTLRFYQGEQLASTVQGSTRVSYLYDGDRPLGQQQMNAPAETLLLLTDANRSVRGESQQQALRETAYGAYGERGNDGMKTLLGFNGEVRDSQSGWYLLGKGYRAYNPELRCFHSPDSLSPFGAGGINPYMYCGGDPVNFRDPTGHFWERAGWVGLGLGILGAGLTVLSFGALTPAYALMVSGGLAAAAKGGIALTAIAAGAGALGTGAAQSLVSDRQTKKVLGQISFGLGIASMALGLGSLKLNGWKSNRASTVDDLDSPAGPWRNPQAYNSTQSALPQKPFVQNAATQTPPPVPPKPTPKAQPAPPTTATRPSLEDIKNVKLKKTPGPKSAQNGPRTELQLVLNGIRNNKTVSAARANPDIQQGKFSNAPVYDLTKIPYE
ncbi:RHS repeat-associated core domain-containing protein, partial [Pseudomonas sp. 5P_5.1_Bac1]|uniref:RHS repeat domain-containing protein n=1 Tax=Pseudomonas sp. 5P_5.1_Bac1 TaxID=2971616 RepID=UPI0029056020